MMAFAVATFDGFRPEVLEFLAGLRADNSREWFQAHRELYERFLLQPAREFVSAMGQRLTALGPDIHAEPKIHGSIFAIARDTRFSPDKTPYKTHLDLWFWQGGALGHSRERPGYFFRLTEQSLILGAGMHSFSSFQSDAADRYRRAVLDDVRGPKLVEAADAVGSHNIYGRTLKRVPAGLPADHPRADWLRHSGLYAETQRPVPPELYTSALADVCFEQYQRVAPLQQWLVDLLSA